MSAFEPRHPWARLVTAARRVTDDRPDDAPFGFAARVATLALATEACAVSLWDRFAVRAVLVAGALALASVLVNYRALSAANPSVAPVEEEILAADDAMSVVLDFAD